MEAVKSSTKVLKFHGNDEDLETLSQERANLRIKHFVLRLPFEHESSYTQVCNFLNTQNDIHNAYNRFSYDPVALALQKYYKGTWYKNHGLTHITFESPNAEAQTPKSIQDIKQIIPSIQPTQKHITFDGFKLDEFAQALLNQVKDFSFDKLSFKNCTFEQPLSDDTLALFSKVKVKRLDLKNLRLQEGDNEKLLSSLEKNYDIHQIRAQGFGLTASQQKRIKTIERRNKWLDAVAQANPYDILKLRRDNMRPWKFDGITHLMEQGRYRKIEIPHGKPSNAVVKQWLEAARNNKDFVRLVYQEHGCDKELTHKLQRQININRGIRKVFGSGNPLFARSALMYTFMGYNFFQSFAMALFPAYALVAGAIGAGVVGGLRVLSNALFHRGLVHTKQADYWDNESTQTSYNTGREAAKSWAPWFSYRAWTTPGYLGYVQEKSHMESAVEFMQQQKPKL